MGDWEGKVTHACFQKIANSLGGSSSKHTRIPSDADSLHMHESFGENNKPIHGEKADADPRGDISQSPEPHHPGCDRLLLREDLLRGFQPSRELEGGRRRHGPSAPGCSLGPEVLLFGAWRQKIFCRTHTLVPKRLLA